MGKLRLRATPVGDALLVHPKDRLDERAAGFAGGLARDPRHTLVVVDLPSRVIADEWAAVAKVLSSSRYGSLRLVFGRGRGDDVRTAAGRIADRLGREVLAPDGPLVPTAAGGLFVPGDEGAAWLRFRPGHAFEPDSQRFPKPIWEFSVPAGPRPAGDRTTVQPVPSGVWLRAAGEPLSGADRRAVETVPTDTRHLLVVLGSPGGAPLPVDDVAGYWDTVLPNARSAVRFVLHGSLGTPDSLAPGQGLANALDHEVVLYADLPSGAPGPGGHVDLPDHTTYTPEHAAAPGHPVTAGQAGAVTASVGEVPRAAPAGTEPGPEMPSGPTALPGAEGRPVTAPEPGERTPVATSSSGGVAPTFAAAWSGAETPSTAAAQAAVDEAPPRGEQAADGTAVTVTVSDGGRAGASTDPSVTAPVPGGGAGAGSGTTEDPQADTTPVVAGRTPSREAVPRIRTESGGSASPSGGARGHRAPDTTSWPDPPASTAASTGPAAAESEPAPAVGPLPTSGLAAPERDPGAGGPGPEPVHRPPHPGPAGPDPDRLTTSTPDPPVAAEPVPDVGTAPAQVQSPEVDPAGTPARADGVGRRPEAREEVPASAPRPVRPAAPRFRLESGAPAPEPEPLAVPAPDAGASAPVPVPAQRSNPAGAATGVRVQPVPRTAACALPPERGVAQERDWVRRTFSDQYHATAGSVSRMMSESPGLRGGSRTEAADALTELVAVRLYLSGDSRVADAAVRAAAAGPHVPLARCVTAGLRRLPSYRGPALLRTRLQDAERAWYRDDRLVTEWAFCHARTSLHAGPRGGGATDVLIWSMTARRTGSLDQAVPDRVVFLPGTSFKVLRTVGDAVLMREVSPSEIADDGRVDLQRVKLDEIALKGLGNILDALEKAGTDAGVQSADPPGLILSPDTGHTGRTEGAKP
ncbi:hypothetical protein [Streptomyces sp. NPDC005244]|uniref:hypothetical protein n=1 Tax=Streptomyces sp. NPDC005244 TaxID=3364708 RepID=UPI003688C626